MSINGNAVKFTPRRKSIAVTPYRGNNTIEKDNDDERNGSSRNIASGSGRRRRRRGGRSSNRRRSGWRKSISSTSSSSGSGRRGREKRLTSAELSELYSSTIKLSQENKINVRNTWSLNLIDYIGMLVKEGWQGGGSGRVGGGNGSSPVVAENGDKGGLTNFQLAGVTLDAGIKIYCSRVDSVHTNAFKVLGGLSRNSGRRGRGNEEEDGSDGEDGDGGGRKRTRRKRAGAVTLEANIDNITLKKMDSDYAVDPLFHKMSAAFDEGGAKGMLLNNLSITDQYELVFDSSTPADSIVTKKKDEQVEPDSVYDISKLVNGIDMSHALTPGFMRYFRAKMNEAGEDDPFSLTDNQQSGVDNSQSVASAGGVEEFGFEYSAGEFENSDHVAGLVAPEEDLGGYQRPSEDNDFAGIDDDDYPDAYGGSNSRFSTSTTVFVARGAVDLLEAGAELAPSAYSFFNAATLSSWAGPAHWRSTASSSQNQGTNGERKRKRPRGKTALLLDFSSEAPAIDFSKLFARGKTTTLSAAVLDGFKESKVTLPEDLGYRTEMLGQLFVKPSVSVFSQRMRAERSRTAVDCADIDAGDAGGDQWYNVDDNGPGDLYGDDDNLDESNPGLGEETNDLGLDMVPEPVRPEKLEISFASVAKKVDVQQLKMGLWADLCGENQALPEIDGNVDDNAEDELEKSACDKADLRAGAEKSVRTIVHNMDKIVPKDALTEVSFPYVFICLLHLANEKELMIKSSEDNRDLIITSEKHKR